MSRLFDKLNSEQSLPKTVVFNLNPKMNSEIMTLIGCFQDSTARGKVQYGPAWLKKSLIYLIIFCLAFCLIFTACATRRPQNHDGSQSTTDSKSSATKETTESTSQQTTEQSSATEITTQTTKQTKPYEVCNTKIRETKALQTEIPELQEKVDMNVETEGKPKVQQKVMLTFGDHRDVPYLFHIGANTYVEKDYLMIWDPGPSPSLYDLQSK